MKLTTLLALAAVGTAIGALMTTKRGKKLQQDIKDASGSLMERLQQLSHKTAGDLNRIGKDTRRMANNLSN
ncbi:YtxH domain-containing protein [Chitinophagaceae bacterium MMS25-I14]